MSRLDWTRDGADWPNREASRFVEAAGLRWHVQRAGAGRTLLLLHGTGAATHSWSGLLPLLARRFDVIAPDLPGHGFTAARPSGFASLPWMARAVGGLLKTLDAAPEIIVGHSAGAAVALRMAIDGVARPAAIVAVNGAVLPFPGIAQRLFPAMARLLFVNPFVPRLMAWRARAEPGAVKRMLDSTGTRLPLGQRAFYERLFGDAGHADAALSMMANWDLDTLEADLPRVAVPVTLIATEGDRWIAPAIAERAATLLPDAKVVRVPALGHLAHEEAPTCIADLIAAAMDAT